MKEEEEKQRTFGKWLMTQVLDTFEHAYALRQRGKTEAELLISFDIFAANGDFDETIAASHRAAIKSAVAAVDEGMPLLMAEFILHKRMSERMEAVINEGKNET